MGVENKSDRIYGVNDEPLNGEEFDDEKLDIEGYYRGLSRFISNCSMPMTIAIQGSWGSGKTTAMNYVRNILEDSSAERREVGTLEFSTWQYSQFNFDETLIFSLLGDLAGALTSEENESRFRKAVRQLARPILKGSALAAASLMGMADAVKVGIDSVEKEGDTANEPEDMATALRELRVAFHDQVEEYCNANEFDRVVIFVDDLDRIEPERAVQIMECLKAFLDSPRCVFVLAIDFDVVARGVAGKFELGTGGVLSEESIKLARRFFDKIIQVPFTMPTHVYSVDPLLSEHLQASDFVLSDEDLTTLRKAILTSVGANPRSVKRLLNTFNLLSLIRVERGFSGRSHLQPSDILLFLTLCAQSAYPSFHRALAKAISRANRDEAVDLVFESIESNQENAGSEDEPENLFPSSRANDVLRRLGIGDDEVDSFVEFVALLKGVLSTDADVHPVNASLLGEAMSLTSITSRESADKAIRERRGVITGDEMWRELKNRRHRSIDPDDLDLLKELEQRLAVESDIALTLGLDSKLQIYAVPSSGDSSDVSIADVYLDSDFKLFFGPDQKEKYWDRACVAPSWKEFEDDFLNLQDCESLESDDIEVRKLGRRYAIRDFSEKRRIGDCVPLLRTIALKMLGFTKSP